MPAVTEAAVRKVLDDVRDPETGRGIGQLGQVHGLRLDGDKLSVTLGSAVCRHGPARRHWMLSAMALIGAA